MIYKIYSCYDTKTASYMRPFFTQARGQAIRDFTEVANDPQSAICKYAGDFSLFELGEFDDSSAAWNLHNQPQLVCAAIELKRSLASASTPNVLKEA